MKVTVDAEGDLFIVRPVGRVDALSAPQFQESMDGVLNDGGKRVIIDMADVAYVSSAGLRVFIRSAKQLMREGKMAVSSLTPGVRQVFEMAGFRMLMTLCDDLDAAKQAVSA